jgi:predicted amidophosphoribosyltransferase
MKKTCAVLGNWYAADLKEMTILQTANMLIPVPLHKKMRKRV